MIARDFDQFRCGINSDNAGPEARQRFGQQPSPAADVQRRLPIERSPNVFVALPMLVDHVAYVFKAHRVELVEHRLGPVRVPPVARMTGELFDLVGNDACFRHWRLLTGRDLRPKEQGPGSAIGEAAMETKKCSGSERVKRNSTSYLANERACQSIFASHPKGMAPPAPDRRRSARTGAYWAALRASPSPSSGRSHVTALAGYGTGLLS